jgi:hypothetical protein
MKARVEPQEDDGARLPGGWDPRVTEAAVGFAITGAPNFRLAEPGGAKAEGSTATMRVFRAELQSITVVRSRRPLRQGTVTQRSANGL